MTRSTARVPGGLLVLAGVLLAVAAEVPLAVVRRPGAEPVLVWMTRTSRQPDAHAWLMALPLGTALALAVLGTCLVLSREVWARVLVRSMAAVFLAVQVLALVVWWAMWSASLPGGADQSLGLGFYLAVLSLVATVVGVLTPGRRVVEDDARRPRSVNPAAMGSAPPGWYDVAGRQCYWDGADWAAHRAGT